MTMCLATQNALKATWHQPYVFEIYPANHEFTLTAIQNVGQTLAPRATRNFPTAPEGASRLLTQERLELEDIGGKQVALDSILIKVTSGDVTQTESVSLMDNSLLRSHVPTNSTHFSIT